MKKILSLLSSVLLVASSSTAVVSCSNSKKQNIGDVAFAKDTVTLSKKVKSKTVKLDIGNDFKLSDYEEPTIDFGGSNSEAIHAVFKDSKLTVSYKPDLVNNGIVNAVLNLNFVNKKDPTNIVRTSNSLTVKFESDKADDYVGIADIDHEILLNEDTNFEKWVSLDTGPNINLNSMKVIFNDDSNKTNQFLNIETRQNMDGSTYLVIGVKNNFKWDVRIDTSFNIAFLTNDQDAQIKLASPIIVQSDTGTIARSVSWETEDIILSSNESSAFIKLNAGSDVNLDSMKVINYKSNINFDVTYDTTQNAVKVSTKSGFNFDEVLTEKIKLEFTLKSTASVSVVTSNYLSVSNKLSNTSKSIEWTSNNLSLQQGQSVNANFTIGDAIDKSSIAISSVDFDTKTETNLSENYILINKTPFNGSLIPLNGKSTFNISGSDIAFNYGFNAIIWLTYKLQNDENNMISVPLIIIGKSNEESRQMIITNKKTDRTTPLSNLNMDINNDAMNFYINSKNINYSDIDWSSFNYEISGQNSAAVTTNVIKNIDFLPATKNKIYGGMVEIVLQKTWQYLKDIEFDLSFKFNLISEPTTQVSSDNLHVNIQKSDYYYWNIRKENASPIISVKGGYIYGYSIKSAYIDLGITLGQGIITDSFRAIDSNGKVIPNDELYIARSRSFTTIKYWLSVSATKDYIDSLFKDPESAAQGAYFTYTIQVLDRTGSVQSQTVRIGFKDAYYPNN